MVVVNLALDEEFRHTNCSMTAEAVERAFGGYDAFASTHFFIPFSYAYIFQDKTMAILLAYVYETITTLANVVGGITTNDIYSTGEIDGLLQDPITALFGAVCAWLLEKLHTTGYRQNISSIQYKLSLIHI